MATIKTVSYSKLFPLGMYTNEKIGVELELDPNENPMEVLETARTLVHDYHFQANKELYEQRGTQIREIEPALPKRSAMEAIIADINTCTEIKVLESYRLIAAGTKEIQEAYDTKFLALSHPTK